MITKYKLSIVTKCLLLGFVNLNDVTIAEYHMNMHITNTA
jgi:hypothetical protein